MINLNAKSIVLLLYHAIAGIIIAVNLQPELWLMGWDGLYPELNVPLNLIRGLSAGWQEYYGAGLVGGHGFAATLPHTAIIGILSAVLPDQLIRQVFILLTYYLGGLGMIFVTQQFLGFIALRKPDARMSWFIGLVSGLYYLFNLGTIQTFYVPLEAFTVHFAAFPWATYITLLILENRSRGRLLALFGVSLLASIQGFIPAVFVAYAASLGIVTGTYVIAERFRKQALAAVASVWLVVIAANAYWMGPVAYFAATGASEYTNSYNNITTTPKFTALSRKYGTISDTAQLRGYLWQSNELGGSIMQPWISHLQNPFAEKIHYGLFAVIIIGTLALFTAKHRGLGFGFFLSALYFFSNIAIDTIPFSWLIDWIRQISPDAAQAFRTTFTKFGIGLGFHYSLLFGLGVAVLLRLLSHVGVRFLGYGLLAIISVILLYTGLPAFRSQLIYPKMYVQLPKQYPELITYLNSLPPGKIADFPQDCTEGWYNTLWGYFGSGFLWYGVEHPVMARAFDVWSRNNENYYWELSRALRNNDYTAAEAVFDKYGIRYILYDQNITHCRSQKGFLPSLEFGNYLGGSANYTKRTTFSGEKLLPIVVYERNKALATAASITNGLPNTGTQSYGDTDAVFNAVGPYVSDPLRPGDVTRPETVFSKRGNPIDPAALGRLNLTAVSTMSASIENSQACSDTAPGAASASIVSAIENGVRLTATDASQCQTYTFDGIDTSEGFVVALTSRHIGGFPLMLSVTNKGRPIGLDITLQDVPGTRTVYYKIPPTFPSEVSYTVTVRNMSYNRMTSINDVYAITLYRDATEPETVTAGTPKEPARELAGVRHPLSWLYIFELDAKNDSDMVSISQSFDPGWVLLHKGRITGRHVRINNWANGWSINEEYGTYYAIFLPQFLEYAGFVVLAGILFYLYRMRI